MRQLTVEALHRNIKDLEEIIERLSNNEILDDIDIKIIEKNMSLVIADLGIEKAFFNRYVDKIKVQLLNKNIKNEQRC